MTLNGIVASYSAATQAVQPVKPPVKDADGDNDGSKSAAAKIGPAVILNLSNTAAATAATDPDGDGK